MGRPRSVSDEQIVEGAVRAIGKHGPSALTLAHVAAEVGITPAAIVQRFGSKRNLLLAIGDASTTAVDAQVDAALARRTPLRALYQVLTAQAREMGSVEEMANHLAFLHLDLADPDLRRRARGHGRALLAGIRRLLDEAVGAGELVVADVDDRALSVYTTFNGALISWALVGRGSSAGWLKARLDSELAPYRVAAATAPPPS